MRYVREAIPLLLKMYEFKTYTQRNDRVKQEGALITGTMYLCHRGIPGIGIPCF